MLELQTNFGSGDPLTRGPVGSLADVDDLEDADLDAGGLAHPTDTLTRRPISHPFVPSVPVQPPFQPGSCPDAEDGHYLLQYNLVGHVSRKHLEDAAPRPGSAEDSTRSSVIDVTFHDVAKHRKRMPPIRPQRDFTMAALSDTGVPLRPCTLSPPHLCRRLPVWSSVLCSGPDTHSLSNEVDTVCNFLICNLL